MNAMEVISARKTTRSYRSGQIDEEILKAVLDAGSAAPVGMAWYDRFHLSVIQSGEILEDISDRIAQMLDGEGDPLYNAPTLVVLSAREDEQTENLELVSAGCIVENMMLAATYQGIGSGVIWGTAMVLQGDETLRAALEIPQGFKPLVSVTLGHADESGAAMQGHVGTIETTLIK